MVKLFRDLKVGDPVYWVYYRRNYLKNVLVEKYKILDIKHKKDNCELELHLTHDLILKTRRNDTDRIKCRDDGSFLVIDEITIEWAVNEIKTKRMGEYQKQIAAITEEMCEIMKAPYQLFDKTLMN